MDPYSYESLAVDIKVVQLEEFGQSATLVCNTTEFILNTLDATLRRSVHQGAPYDF